MDSQKQVQPYYNERGQLSGVWISAQKWLQHQTDLENILLEQERKPASPAEPMHEWMNFLSYWDFNYPVEKKVVCQSCGCASDDWTQDSPKKFYLRNASLGGLVAFVCLGCQSRVTKKHFKDHILYECSDLNCKVR